MTLRRPLFAGDELTITVERSAIGARVVARRRLAESCSTGPSASAPRRGRASSIRRRPGPALDPPFVRPTYTVATAPIGEALRPLGAYVSFAAARRLALDDLGQTRSCVPGDRLHPWFLAARMAPLTRHNFTYGPTIHVRTQIQHRGPAVVEQEVVVGARIVEVYERNEHWYQVLDGLVVGDGGGPGCPELARIRHHSIFRPRGTTMPPPITGDPLA